MLLSNIGSIVTKEGGFIRGLLLGDFSEHGLWHCFTHALVLVRASHSWFSRSWLLTRRHGGVVVSSATDGCVLWQL